MSEGPVNAPTAPTEFTRAIPAPAALPLKRAVVAPQNKGKAPKIPMEATANPRSEVLSPWNAASTRNPLALSRYIEGNHHFFRSLPTRTIASAPAPYGGTAHQPEAVADVPRETRIFGSQKVG